MANVIHKSKNSTNWGDIIGAGLSGFANGYTGMNQIQQNKEQNNMMNDLMQNMFGGGQIVTAPIAENPAVAMQEVSTQQKPIWDWSQMITSGYAR